MDSRDQMDEMRRRRREGQIWAGMFLLLVGAVVLMRQLSFDFLPYWLFSWPMILIAIGVFIGIRHNFTGAAWLIMILIGSIFLADDMFPNFDFHRFIVPAIIISVGLVLILRPRNRIEWRDRRRYWEDWKDRRFTGPNPPPPPTPGDAPKPDSPPHSKSGSEQVFEDRLNSVAVFGGAHKIILSKNFKGGEATSFFGGTEIDLSQADIQGTVVLDLTQILGGCKLIVPAHWYLKNEISAVFGGVEDKRQVRPVNPDPNKILIVKGVSFLGGLEIRNY